MTIDANALRARQAPLKQTYRDHPEAARVTTRAEALLDQPALGCTLTTKQGHTIHAGLHPATGGDGSAACAGDMLLEALLACAGTTLAAVATASGVDLGTTRITAEADWDARGTLGIDRTTPIGLTAIRLHFAFDPTIEAPIRQRLITTTEKYCIVLQTLRTPPTITTT